MKALKHSLAAYIPLIIMGAFLAGFFCSILLLKDSGRSVTEKKLSNILNIIRSEYVDNVDIDSLLEATFPELLANLDPHSIYIPAADLESVNEDLEGSFSGVGVSFAINSDTIFVIESVAGGPAERVGIEAGDRIIAVDGENVAGIGIVEDSVFSKLRGPKGTEVLLTIKRPGIKKPIDFNVERGDIAVTSIDAEYMLADRVGYIKVNKFGRTTYEEFYQSLCYLKEQGADKFIIDLRGNPGGLLESAVLMANEFFPQGYKIVQTRGRHPADNSTVISDGTGDFRQAQVVVLMDESSASSSEIFAGAIQDNDRGLILGRRSFGKGLVQNQIELPDASAIRLTVARYYTPSGRCIQKDYSDLDVYQNDLIDRYTHGEAFEADSMRVDTSTSYSTLNGRTVYGGGGIIPDIFVPNDTIGLTQYYVNLSNAGLFQKYTIRFVDDNRAELSKADNVDELMAMLPSDDRLLRSFVNFGAENGIPVRWYYVNISGPLIVNRLKALIARDLLGTGAFYEVVNLTDPAISEAIRQLEQGKAKFPLSD